jgi:hypothetical protein
MAGQRADTAAGAAVEAGDEVMGGDLVVDRGIGMG